MTPSWDRDGKTPEGSAAHWAPEARSLVTAAPHKGERLGTFKEATPALLRLFQKNREGGKSFELLLQAQRYPEGNQRGGESRRPASPGTEIQESSAEGRAWPAADPGRRCSRTRTWSVHIKEESPPFLKPYCLEVSSN